MIPHRCGTAELIQIPAAVHRQLCLHLKPVGCHAVEGTQQTVEAGEDTHGSSPPISQCAEFFQRLHAHTAVLVGGQGVQQVLSGR